MSAAVDLVDELVETIRLLDENTALWAGDRDRAAAAAAIAAADTAARQLPGVRGALTAEARDWDAAHRPHDPRD